MAPQARSAAMASICCALCACVGRPAPALRLTDLSPSQAGDEAGMELQISGEHFLPRVETRFGDERLSGVDDGFEARLVPVEAGLSEVPLVDVRRVSDRLLTATAPAGMARGFYSLEVVGPSGHRARLSEVFRVVRSTATLAGFVVRGPGPQRVGVPFWAEAQAVDALGQLVDGFAGTVRLGDLTGTVGPAVLGPFALGRARGLVVVSSEASADVLRVDGEPGLWGESEPFEVSAGLAVRLALSGVPAQLSAGACSGRAEAQTQDFAGLPGLAGEPVSVSVEGAPAASFELFSDDACLTPASGLQIPAGRSAAGFSFRSTRAGTLRLKASARGLPGAVASTEATPLAAVRLEFASASPRLSPGACSPAVLCGPVDAWGNPAPVLAPMAVALAAQPAGSLRFWADAACTVPLPVGALESKAALFTLYASPGPVSASNAFVRAEAGALAAGLLAVEVGP